MSLLFGGAASDRVNVGSGTVLDNVNQGTLIALAYPTGSGNGRFYQKGVTGQGPLFFSYGASLEIARNRATTASDALSLVSNFSAHALNQWNWYAGVWNTGGANGDQKLYVGTLTTPFAEPSAYGTQTVGSGAEGDNSAVDAIIGNNSNAALAFPGRIACVIHYNVALTLGQLRAVQFGDAVLPGRVGYWELGWNGTGTQPDYSGNGNAGTVTGATVAVHAPVRNPFGGRAMPQAYPVPVGGGGVTPYYYDRRRRA